VNDDPGSAGGRPANLREGGRETGAPPTPALELRGIDKRFGAVHANRGISLSVARGSVHGLIGENGAGKSTLMNIVYGFHRADAGEILVRGRRVDIHAPHDAIAAGIGMVHQHFMLVENFTVLENVVLGVEGGALLAGGLGHARGELEKLARDYGLEVPLDTVVAELPVGLQQRVEILKALYRRAEILILDEPTAVLTPQEADQLFRMLRLLRDEGKTVILVTHKLREIMAVTDRVTVMRQGAVVGEVATTATSPRELAEKMVGRAVLLQVEKGPAHPGGALLTVENLEVRDRLGVARVKGVSFALRAGEIVGIAGVSGNGQKELMAALSGERTLAEADTITLLGTPCGRMDAAQRRALGFAFVPEERLGRGAVPEMSLTDNALLTAYRQGMVTRGFVRGGVVREYAAETIRAYGVKAGGPDAAARSLSGGNLQKFIVGREIRQQPKMMIAAQPTWGVDVGAAAQIRQALLDLRDNGVAVLVVSEELDELFEICDCLAVIAQGRLSDPKAVRETNAEEIGLLMAGSFIHKGTEGQHAVSPAGGMAV